MFYYRYKYTFFTIYPQKGAQIFLNYLVTVNKMTDRTNERL